MPVDRPAGSCISHRYIPTQLLGYSVRDCQRYHTSQDSAREYFTSREQKATTDHKNTKPTNHTTLSHKTNVYLLLSTCIWWNRTRTTTFPTAVLGNTQCSAQGAALPVSIEAAPAYLNLFASF